jgi:glutamine amidotransferase
MHNGGIGDFAKVKRRMHALLREEYFLFMQGSTDSECAFALFLNCLHDLGFSPSEHTKFEATVLRQAMLNTIAIINRLCQEAGCEEPSLLNFAVTDGCDVVCTRYISSRTDEAASLFFSSGTSFHGYKQSDGTTGYRMHRGKGQSIVLVSSEPLTFQRADWVTVPTNSILTIREGTVLIHPILDDYFVDQVSHIRVSSFLPIIIADDQNESYATSKGLLGMTAAMPI